MDDTHAWIPMCRTPADDGEQLLCRDCGAVCAELDGKDFAQEHDLRALLDCAFADCEEP